MPGFSSLLDLEKAPLARPYTESGYDLVRYRAWVDALGAPDKGQSFLHIAGTKG
jgi:folylpolyglutamate synthase/dihydropteroate synthase